MSPLTELWTQIVEQFQSVTASALPPVAAALLLLLAGWLFALLGRAVVSGLLRRVGLDRLAERLGADRALNQLGIEMTVSSILGRVIYWFILLIFVLAAANRLGLVGVTEALRIFIGYLPSVLAAALILFLGVVLGRFLGNAVGTFAEQAGVSGGRILGQAVRFFVIALTVILAMEQLNLETQLLSTIAVIAIGAVALAMGLAFGLGSRDLARSIMAGFHAREAFQVGQRLTVRHHTGQLVRINAAQAVLETEDGYVSLPNTVLLEEEILVLDETEGAA
ncbi:MAG: mechanosensitive ion channel [Anaerolineae bacterium]|jgi:small-conductance mechanosensitive channel